VAMVAKDRAIDGLIIAGCFSKAIAPERLLHTRMPFMQVLLEIACQYLVILGVESANWPISSA